MIRLGSHACVVLASRLVLAASIAALAACAPKPEQLPLDAKLDFAKDGKPVATMDLAAMTAIVKAADVDPDDPIYKTRKHFRGVPLRPLLEAAYGDLKSLKDKQFL